MKPRERIARLLGPRWMMRLRRVARAQERPRWGNLRRLAPFSANYGFDRGTPVDRYYLNGFLDRHRELITGRVLEVQTDGHARRYGRDLEGVDTVVLSMGSRSTDGLYRELKGRVAELYAVGDCVAPRGVHQAILDATRAARQL